MLAMRRHSGHLVSQGWCARFHWQTLPPGLQPGQHCPGRAHAAANVKLIPAFRRAQGVPARGQAGHEHLKQRDQRPERPDSVAPVRLPVQSSAGPQQKFQRGYNGNGHFQGDCPGCRSHSHRNCASRKPACVDYCLLPYAPQGRQWGPSVASVHRTGGSAALGRAAVAGCTAGEVHKPFQHPAHVRRLLRSQPQGSPAAAVVTAIATAIATVTVAAVAADATADAAAGAVDAAGLWV
mmetsp:Transcript_7233/g.21297  ORF Transcript_7233/g.21297 Transcript_7233/m.21297 type:complete len:237 (-) Transcript_7233:677-1387(-)